MNKPEWAHWTEAERDHKLEEAKKQRIEYRKKKGMWIGCSFPGYEDHEYQIRAGAMIRRAEQRVEVKRGRKRMEVMEDDDEEELPMIKGEVDLEGVRRVSSAHVKYDDEEEAEGQPARCKIARLPSSAADTVSRSGPDGEYEIGSAIVRGLSYSYPTERKASCEGNLIFGASTPSRGDSVMTEGLARGNIEVHKGWQWVEKRGWTPIIDGSSMSVEPADIRVSERPSRGVSHGGDSHIRRKRVNLDELL